MDIIQEIRSLENQAREIYRSFINPLFKQEKQELINTLEYLSTELEKLANNILELNRKTAVQYSTELNNNKMNEFHNNFSKLSTDINKHLYLEKNKKEINNDLLNLKEQISKPQTYYDFEEHIKNEINLFIKFLDNAKLEINKKYTNIAEKQKSVDELLKIIDRKNEKILELNQSVHNYKWLEAKEKAKESHVSNLEQELLKKTKLTESYQTLTNSHISKLEKQINEMNQNIQIINNEVKKLESKYKEKEKISLELIKELKDELLQTRYALSKKD